MTDLRLPAGGDARATSPGTLRPSTAARPIPSRQEPRVAEPSRGERSVELSRSLESRTSDLPPRSAEPARAAETGARIPAAAPRRPGQTPGSGPLIPAGDARATSSEVAAARASGTDLAAARTTGRIQLPPAGPEGLTALPRNADVTAAKVRATPGPSSIPAPGPSPARSQTVRLDKSTAGKRPMNATEIRGKPASQLSLPPEADELDHKGRSRPLYARRTHRPPSYQPGPLADFLLGLFPGARLMAREKVVSGLGYAVIGLFTLLPAILVVASWRSGVEAMEAFSIDRRWLLAHAAVVVVALLSFELLRFASSMDRIHGRLRASRGLAALFLPALAISIGAPLVLTTAPSIVEPIWFGGLFLTAIGALSALDSVTSREGEASGGTKRVVLSLVLLVTVLLAGVLVLVVSPESSQSLEQLASSAGFELLPKILRALRV